MQIYSPVLLTISQYPENAQISFEIIKKLKPQCLYIVGHSEVSKIASAVDWQCKVESYVLGNQDDSALSWFFSKADEGIIIQDTCIIDSSFPHFAQAMLERYRAKKEVIIVNGNNPAGNWKSKYSYFFSHIGIGGAWATWKRAWESDRKNLLTLFEQNFQYLTPEEKMSIVPIIPMAFPLNHQITFDIESNYDKLMLDKFGKEKFNPRS